MYKKRKFNNEPRPIAPKSAFLKMAKYCSYQDRCEHDIITQLNKYILSDEEKAEIIEKFCRLQFHLWKISFR